ncbi:porin [Mesorhizobium sp. BH1-1-5]|uniref:porin n=1 Tax=Mesorhizobium sp. BH1-1-5 TaxID=2876661 RepID=UPI001CCFFDD0|nr:porin [Mesorhizobium sp. BH1-1-5]MBZ9991245.1 porin [Mesorhizobium sp. BH1-1-5]
MLIGKRNPRPVARVVRSFSNVASLPLGDKEGRRKPGILCAPGSSVHANKSHGGVSASKGLSQKSGEAAFGRHVRRLCMICLCALRLLSPAFAQGDGEDEEEEDSAVCDIDVGGSGSESKSLSTTDGTGSHRYLVHGVCYDLSGSLQGTLQHTNAPEPHLGPGSRTARTFSSEADLRLAAARLTESGPFKFVFGTSWSYNTDDGFDAAPTLSEATIEYAGVKVGYAESLMNAWSGDFQFTASSPSLSSYLASYKYEITDDLSSSVAVEAGPPTSRGATTWEFPKTPPYFTAQLHYEKDDWIMQVSAAAHRQETPAAPLLDLSAGSRFGWAATAGLTAPVRFAGEDDNFSAGLAYSVDAPAFLGTAADAAAFAARFPTVGPIQGWSAVASYHHKWSDKWESNAFVSYVAVNLDLFATNPSIRTKRYGVNLIFRPAEKWTIGAEVDALSTHAALNGAVGLIPGANLKGTTDFLWVTREF